MPIAFRKSDMTRAYLYANKDDGERAMMVGGGGEWVLFDRSMETIKTGRYAGEGFLLDGELMPDGSYRVFDCLVWNSENRTSLPIRERLSGVEPPMGTIKAWHDQPPPRTPDSDGIILVSKDGGYYDPPLKWKERHTVDFRLSRGCLYVLCDYGRESAAVIIRDRSKFSQYQDGCIIECELVGGEWVPVRARPDKERPNSLIVLVHTLVTMVECHNVF